MSDCHVDFETKSDVDIRTRGAYVYFESSHTAPLMASYRFGKGPVRRWLPGEPCPQDIREHAARGGRFVGHNAGSFERRLWETILVPRYGFPPLLISQWRCTLAQASALGLPRSLEKLGDALNLTVKKDKIGKALIKFFCTPIGWRDGAPVFNDPADHPVKFEQFRDYCDDDVRTESEADERMIPLSDAEQAVWQLDQAINDRGIRIDRASAVAAINLVEKAKAELDAKMRELTDGAVGACTQVAKLTAWCEAQGVALAGVAKDDILEALDLVDLPGRVKTALLLRQEAGKSSTSKLKAFLSHAGSDDRVRGSFVYHGAAPGRWCLAEGSPVLVKTPFDEILEKPIEDVDAHDLVWDGDSWVSHGGVIFSGKKSVITHDGVTATPEHIVYLDKTRYTTLGEAKRRGLKIYESSPAEVHNLRGDLAVRQAVCGNYEEDS